MRENIDGHLTLQKDPSSSASNAFDAAGVVLQGLAEGHHDAQSLNEYLRRNTFQTATFGAIRFDDIGGVRGGTFAVRKALPLHIGK